MAGALAIKATKEISEVAKDQAERFLSNVLGEPATALGGLFVDKINIRRFRNLVNTVVEAKRLLAERGLTEKDVPLNIIHPALEAASLAEDHDLRTLWANLLANAADPRNSRQIEAAFVGVFKELSSRDGKFLGRLFQLGNGSKLDLHRNPCKWHTAMRASH
ncbi:MAG TPA: Abi-alpha family protein [Bryobacteraceae bacterium]|jgi:hypothetical protein|nr:Abi-alpha family protein [Bryobacteraceae bacterium]